MLGSWLLPSLPSSITTLFSLPSTIRMTCISDAPPLSVCWDRSPFLPVGLQWCMSTSISISSSAWRAAVLIYSSPTRSMMISTGFPTSFVVSVVEGGSSPYRLTVTCVSRVSVLRYHIHVDCDLASIPYLIFSFCLSPDVSIGGVQMSITTSQFFCYFVLVPLIRMASDIRIFWNTFRGCNILERFRW